MNSIAKERPWDHNMNAWLEGIANPAVTSKAVTALVALSKSTPHCSAKTLPEYQFVVFTHEEFGEARVRAHFHS